MELCVIQQDCYKRDELNKQEPTAELRLGVVYSINSDVFKRLKGMRWALFGGKRFIVRDIENTNSFSWDSNHLSICYGSSSLSLNYMTSYLLCIK